MPSRSMRPGRIVLRCGYCGGELLTVDYEDNSRYMGAPGLKNIQSMYGNVCPHCYRQLSRPARVAVSARPRRA